MPKADPTPTTSRRALFAAVPAAALGAAVTSCIARPVMAAAVNPDADLIALCEEYVALDREFCRLGELTFDMRSNDPEFRRIEARTQALVSRLHELENILTDRAPQTVEGLRAQARAALHCLACDASGDAEVLDYTGVIAWPVITALLAMLDAGKLA
jgi:hypothetical protein